LGPLREDSSVLLAEVDVDGDVLGLLAEGRVGVEDVLGCDQKGLGGFG